MGETYAIHSFSVSLLPIHFFSQRHNSHPHVSHVASDQHMQPPFIQIQSASDAFMLRGGSTFTDKDSGIFFLSWLPGRKIQNPVSQNRRRLHLRGT